MKPVEEKKQEEGVEGEEGQEKVEGEEGAEKGAEGEHKEGIWKKKFL